MFRPYISLIKLKIFQTVLGKIRSLLESVLMFSCVFRFSKAFFFLCSDIFIHGILKLCRHLDIETFEGYHGNFVISHVKLQINAEISRQN